MKRHLTASLLAGSAILLLSPAPGAADTTVPIYGTPGTGHVLETTNDSGTVIRHQQYSEDDKLTKDTHYDGETGKPTGSTEHTYDDEGNKSTTTERNGEGERTETSTFRKDGKVAEHERFGEFERPVDRTEFTYDENGELTDINVFGPDGMMAASYHYIRKDGKLVSVSQMDHTTVPSSDVGTIHYRPDGSVEELTGNVDAALAALGMSVDPTTHTTTGADGSHITVKHNDDGTYDVTVVHLDHRVTTEHLRHGAGCYLGDACPYEDSEGNKLPQSADPSNQDTASGEPISQLPPARTGGMPADVRTPAPSIGTDHSHGAPRPGVY